MVTFSEHTVKLPDGIELCYTDSQAPPSSSYTTLVVLHGSAFTGDGFIPLHKYAHQNNLRVIALNRRDYRGSTKYTDAELEDLNAGRKVFQDRLAIQLAWFLEHLINEEGTPKVSPDHKAGGLILVAWSFGNATMLSLFADPTTIPKALYETIEPHLLSVVLYEPAYPALGYPEPPDERFYKPFADPDYAAGDAFYSNIQHWSSSYYAHPDIASGKASGISYAKRTEKCTVSSWTDEERERYFDSVAAVRSEFPAFAPPMQATLKFQGEQALLNAESPASYFPDVKFLYICGTQTCSFCMWAYMECLRLYEQALERGEKVRPMKFRLIDGGNHFLHYDAPERFLREILDGCSDL